MTNEQPKLTAQYIVDLFAKHPEVKPGRGTPHQKIADQDHVCASAIIALDEGVDVKKDRNFPIVAKLYGIADDDDVLGLAVGFDGREPNRGGSTCNQVRRDLYLIGREAAELLNLPVPPLDEVLAYFKENPVAS